MEEVYLKSGIMRFAYEVKFGAAFDNQLRCSIVFE